MKQFTLVISLIFLGFYLNAQNLYITKTAKLSFFSEAPLENIDAHSEKGTSILNTETKGVVCKVAIKSFLFKKPLMQEHFNENYMESEKYEFAILKGIIKEDIDFSKDGTYDVNVEGELDLHGVKQNRTISGTLTIENGKISIQAEFQVKVVDHDIKIPKLVIENIAEVIDVKFSAEYEPHKKN
ncbi:YceI family protein [Candidatus Amoebophilus asiaticus]|nr:YceI family protein [Candidatus Amoebophilus asiaticus]